MHAVTQSTAANAAGVASGFAETTVADYLVFRVAGKQYGAALHKVHELRRFDEVGSATAGAAPNRATIGTIGVQGFDVPVIDMAAMLGHVRSPQDFDAEVIVLNCDARMVAVTAECVIDVVSLAPSQMRLAPAIRAEDAANHMAGIGRIDQRVLALLDIDKLILEVYPTQLAA